jgi:hypothetical protein
MKTTLAKLSSLTLLIAGLSVGLCLWRASPAHAAFVANDVIDDNVFNNTGSMTAAQINTFLNANFPNSCISTNHGFSAADPVGYNPTQGFIFGGPVSAGQVIYDAAQAYGLNPQVLVTTLEKEENLVTGGSGCASWRYASAVGFSCTDSGTNSHTYTYTNGTDPGSLPTPLYYINGAPQNSITNSCVSSPLMAGFSEQLIWASWLLEKGLQRSDGNVNWAVVKPNWDNSDESNCYGGPMTQGNWKRCRTDAQPTFYDGYITIDGQSVHMDTGATASLYWYTPHFSGNISFVNLFEAWFGPTKGSLVQAAGDKTVYLLSGSTAYPISDINVLNDFAALGPLRVTSAGEINTYSSGPVLGRMVGGSDGTLYLVNASIKLPFTSCASVADYGYSCGGVITLTAAQLNRLSNGPAVTPLIKSVSNGTIYYVFGGQKRPIVSWGDYLSFHSIQNTFTDALVNQIPTNPIPAYGPGSLVKTANSGTVYIVKDIGNLVTISNFIYPKELGLSGGLRTIVSNYTVLGGIENKLKCGSTYYLAAGGLAFPITSGMMTNYGFSSGQFVDGGLICPNLQISSQALDQYIRVGNGTIYFVSSGQKQAFTSYSSYLNHGGSASNTVQVSDFFAGNLASGANL